MDNGQPVNYQSQDPAFFTAGVGDAPEKTNPDIKGSLNTEVYSSDHDAQRVGNVAISSSETEATTPLVERINIITSPYEGLKSNSPEEIVNLAMPPGAAPEINPEILRKEEKQPSLEHSPFIITKEKRKGLDRGLDKKTVERIQKEIIDPFLLGEERDIAKLYDIVRGKNGYVFNTLKDSYGDNSAWKETV